jgi:hypothetical protein
MNCKLRQPAPSIFQLPAKAAASKRAPEFADTHARRRCRALPARERAFKFDEIELRINRLADVGGLYGGNQLN